MRSDFDSIEELIDYIQYHEYKPHEIIYDELGVYVPDHNEPNIVRNVFLCDNSRLVFAKVLGIFAVDNRWDRYEPEHLWFGGRSSVIHCKTDYGQNFRFGENCVIGGDGFGYVKSEDGSWYQMPHLGRVVIGDNVTIHNNVCIDRGVTGDTVIGAGTKIDNLVHIAHGVKIGKNCLIVAGAVIGGSCEIGDNCFIGINASIKNKVKIGNNVTIGMGAVVLKDLPDGVTVVGNPARVL